MANAAIKKRGKQHPSTKVQLSVSARNLPDKDTFSKTDPMAVVLLKGFQQENFVEVGRTERIDNNLNPDFVQKFTLDHFFEQKQFIKVQLYHTKSKSHILKDQTFIGETTFPLGKAASCGKLSQGLRTNEKPQGTLEVVVEQLTGSQEDISLEFEGTKLDKKDTFGKSDPFLEIWKENDNDEDFSLVHRTEFIKNTLNPKWEVMTIRMQNLCGGKHDRVLRFICYDWNRSGSHSEIGRFETDTRSITRGPGKHNVFNLINKKKKDKHGVKYTNSGQISLKSCSMKTNNNMFDYINGGTQIQATVAIDFTESNGDPTDPKSLHHSSPSGGKNMYERAIHAVVEIIEDYDSDKLIPAFGFGAIVPPDTEVSHMFPLNSNNNNPSCHGVNGVLEAYAYSLQQVRPSGPTCFAPIIKHVAEDASREQNGSQYHILLILTDGTICDMKDTKSAIIEASGLPLSIIIIGIGNDDFTAMEILDGDGDRRLELKGKQAERDIVQFVAMNAYAASGMEENMILARDVLAEVPEQLLSFMSSKGIKPTYSKGRKTIIEGMSTLV